MSNSVAVSYRNLEVLRWTSPTTARRAPPACPARCPDNRAPTAGSSFLGALIIGDPPSAAATTSPSASSTHGQPRRRHGGANRSGPADRPRSPTQPPVLPRGVHL